MGRVKTEEKKKEEERRSQKRESQKKEDPGAPKGRKVAIHCFLPMICGSGGSKSRLAKAAGAEPAGQRRDEKLHAVVARSTCVTEKAKNTSPLDHFWTLICRKSARRSGAKHFFEVKMYKAPQLRSTFRSCDVEKSARRCGAKHISKSKCQKDNILGPLFDVQMPFRVAGARDCAPCQEPKVSKT